MVPASTLVLLRYMNSQECLVGPGTGFLGDYRLLLRADMDTFPTPRFRGLWPEGVLVDRNYQTNFGLRRCLKDMVTGFIVI